MIDDTANQTPEEDPQGTETPESEETPVEAPKAETPEEVEPTAEEPAPVEAPEEAPKEEEAEWDLDQDTLDAIVATYGDRLRKSKGMEETITRDIKDEVARQVRGYVSTTDSQSQVDQLIGRGKAAAANIQRLADAAKTELGKGEEADPNVFDSKELITSLEQYGSATAMYERHILETATQSGFDGIFGDVLPELSDTSSEELSTITNTVNRMRGDQNQFSKADGFWMSELLKFVAHRGMEHGAEQERNRVVSKQTVKERIVNSNAVTAAKANLEAAKAPPRTPKSEPREAIPEFSEEGYRKMKEAGDNVKTQEYVNRWSSRRSVGQAISR